MWEQLRNRVNGALANDENCTKAGNFQIQVRENVAGGAGGCRA